MVGGDPIPKLPVLERQLLEHCAALLWSVQRLAATCPGGAVEYAAQCALAAAQLLLLAERGAQREQVLLALLDGLKHCPEPDVQGLLAWADEQLQL